MDDSISNRTNTSPTGRSGSDSGDARRFRLREFHERKSRAPGFYARPSGEPGGASFFPEPATDTRREWKAPPVKFGAGSEARLGRWKVVVLVMAGLAAASVLAGLAGYCIGRERGKVSANREIVERAKTLKRLPENDSRILSEAMTEMRAGRADTAMDMLLSLRTKFPQAGSLSYLAALAALQAGQPAAAENLAKDSIKAGQRLSDSLALMSMLERQKAATAGSGSESRAEELLRAAITADAANPSPHLELAALLRGAGRREEARREIKAALALLNPVDAQAVTEVTLALMDLEDKPDNQISPPPQTPRSLLEYLTAAYASMRKGDFAAAADHLRAGRGMTSPDIFFYLINDPVFRKYQSSSEVAEFWQ